MADSHPKNLDPRPKRRRDEDNPYTIFTTGINTAAPHYYLSFVDSSGVERCVEIDKPLFDAFDRFELEDISFMHKVDKHHERTEQAEASLNKQAVEPQEGVRKLFLSRWRQISSIRQSTDCLKNSAAVWCCTTLGSLHTSRLRIWRDARFRRSKGLLRRQSRT